MFIQNLPGAFFTQFPPSAGRTPAKSPPGKNSSANAVFVSCEKNIFYLVYWLSITAVLINALCFMILSHWMLIEINFP